MTEAEIGVRIGMVVPSLNTIAEDDFRRFAPSEVGIHIHRQRLPKIDGKVTIDSLKMANEAAEEAAAYLSDMGPDAIAFNCTGASVAAGPGSDHVLNTRMKEALGLPCTNTMLAIKDALRALNIHSLVHICPFEGPSARIERESLEEDGLRLVKSEAMGFSDAQVAARMSPDDIARHGCDMDIEAADGILLSCANVRAFEAAALLEQQIGKPVITSNQAMLWSVLRLAGWKDGVDSPTTLFRNLEIQHA